MWYMMKPVRVTIDVPESREDVFDFLDVMANHEPFTNHILKDWQYSGPDRGVGSKARVHVKAAGRTEKVDIEVVSAESPSKIVEQNVSAGGKRQANGTYTLEELPAGGTRINFEYAWRQAPLADQLAAPLVRSTLRRANERAMQRLAEQLATRRESPFLTRRPAAAAVGHVSLTAPPAGLPKTWLRSARRLAAERPSRAAVIMRA